jgi:hypothetical protein
LLCRRCRTVVSSTGAEYKGTNQMRKIWKMET